MMESSKITSDLTFEAINEDYAGCFLGLRKCGYTAVESLMLAFGDFLITFNSLEIEELMKSIWNNEQKIHDSRDSLEVQIFKVDLDLSVCLLRNAINQFLGEKQL